MGFAVLHVIGCSNTQSCGKQHPRAALIVVTSASVLCSSETFRFCLAASTRTCTKYRLLQLVPMRNLLLRLVRSEPRDAAQFWMIACSVCCRKTKQNVQLKWGYHHLRQNGLRLLGIRPRALGPRVGRTPPIQSGENTPILIPKDTRESDFRPIS